MRSSLRVFSLVTVIGGALLVTPWAASAATTALWRMNETSGQTMYDAVGSADGTNHHITEGLPGIAGSRAYGFNGFSSYVSVPTRSALNPGTAKLTVKVAVRFSRRPAQDYDLIRKGRARTPGGYYKVEIVRSGQAICLFGGSKATVTVIGGPRLNDGRWHRISCIRSARRVRLYVDGRRAKQAWKVVGRIANSSTLFVGAKPGSDWYRGRLDAAKILIG